MTVTRTEKTKVEGDVTCVVETVESGIARMYLGTNKGRLYKYNNSTGAVTEVNPFPGVITCGVYDASTYIYFGCENGKVYRYTIADGTLSVLYSAQEGIKSIDLYSSTLWIGMLGGKFINLTVS